MIKVLMTSTAFLLLSCASEERIQVQRSVLTFVKLEVKNEYPKNKILAIWKDEKGIEYEEFVREEDTSAYRNRSISSLIKR
jgi:hypothetical protein